MALFHLARLTAPAMVAAGSGAIIVTGNTSAASIPLAMHQLLKDGDVKSGGLALEIGFGAGLAFAQWKLGDDEGCAFERGEDRLRQLRCIHIVGIGMDKLDELAHYRSRIELDTMRTIKRALDPKNIMNPGKVLRI